VPDDEWGQRWSGGRGQARPNHRPGGSPRIHPSPPAHLEDTGPYRGVERIAPHRPR
jgi:hypothetical protein